MESRKTDVIFGKVSGNTSRNSYTCNLSIPKAWVDRMGLTPDHREVALDFDGDRITVERPQYSPIKHAPLASNHKIRRFALIWQQMYQNHAFIPYNFFDDIEFLAEGLSDLGFVMDCGESMKELFPDLNIGELEEWKMILPRVNDIQILGNAIYSHWRYWNHWSMSPMQEDDYQWFVIAFSRLAELAESG